MNILKIVFMAVKQCTHLSSFQLVLGLNRLQWTVPTYTPGFLIMSYPFSRSLWDFIVSKPRTRGKETSGGPWAATVVLGLTVSPGLGLETSGNSPLMTRRGQTHWAQWQANNSSSLDKPVAQPSPLLPGTSFPTLASVFRGSIPLPNPRWAKHSGQETDTKCKLTSLAYKCSHRGPNHTVDLGYCHSIYKKLLPMED